MKQILILIFSLSFFFFTSCKNESLTNESTNEFTPVFGIEDQASARNTMSQYYIFGMLTNGAVQISSRKIENTDIPKVCKSNTVFRSIKTDHLSITNGGTFKVDGKPINYSLEGGYENPRELSGCNNLENYYGRNVKFSLEKNGETVFETNVYSPEKLESFTPDNPEPYQTGYSHYWLDRTNPVPLSFNADPNNNNGVLIVAQGKGDILGIDPASNTEMKFSMRLVPDNGQVNLPPDFFEDFLQNELITISLYRGGLNLIEANDGNSYKTYCMSEIKQEFIIK